MEVPRALLPAQTFDEHALRINRIYSTRRSFCAPHS